MDEQTISRIVSEIRPQLEGRRLGKVFQSSRAALFLDFRTSAGLYLFLSVEPSSPRLYLAARHTRELEKQSQSPSPFIFSMRRHLGGGTLLSLNKDEGERVVRFFFSAPDEMGETHERWLIAQLTGRTANLLLLDEESRIIDSLRPPRGEGQEIGDKYQPPPAQAQSGAAAAAASHTPFEQGSFASLSEAADEYYRGLEAGRAFAARAAAARARLHRTIAQRRKLQKHLTNDLAAHGDADEHKRIGELLLANIGTAERRGHVVAVTDYYAEGTPRVELEIDENSTLQEAAAHSFSRYTKAKRAAAEISVRLEALEKELASLEAQRAELEDAITTGTEDALALFEDERTKPSQSPSTPRARKAAAESVAGARRYRSSDGYEILVGRAARDNDHLTFRVARPHDLWLHAADYPGSHVLVRNSSRKEIPHRTIVEAAQLAANFSHARRDAKVDVHYTQRKFLAKPKGTAPGLVRMSTFRTITVEPRDELERI